MIEMKVVPRTFRNLKQKNTIIKIKNNTPHRWHTKPVVRRSSVLGPDFLTILKGKADVVNTVDGGEIHQAVPALWRKFHQCIR